MPEPHKEVLARPGPLRILVLEDQANDAKLMIGQLRRAGLNFTAMRVDTRTDFIEALETFTPDVVLLADPPEFDGTKALAHVRHVHPEIPALMVSDASDEEAVIELLKTGARDYVLKGNLLRLPSAVERAILVEQGIRARKAAEAAIAISELQYRRLFESARDGLLILDADTTRIIDINPYLVELLGYNYKYYLGKTLAIARD